MVNEGQQAKFRRRSRPASAEFNKSGGNQLNPQAANDGALVDNRQSKMQEEPTGEVIHASDAEVPGKAKIPDWNRDSKPVS